MFDFSASSIFASLIWGSVGSVVFIYGKKRQAWTPLFCGLAMVLGSYFIESAAMMSLASILILVVMYVLHRQGY